MPALFFLGCMINIFLQMKKCLVELMNQLPYFITQSIDWYDGLTRSVMNSLSFFLEKTTAFDLLVLRSLQRNSV